jgi:hypothetical protein
MIEERWLWLACALVALPAPRGWLGLTAPAVMLVLIVFVTVMPPSAEQE